MASLGQNVLNYQYPGMYYLYFRRYFLCLSIIFFLFCRWVHFSAQNVLNAISAGWVRTTYFTFINRDRKHVELYILYVNIERVRLMKIEIFLLVKIDIFLFVKVTAYDAHCVGTTTSILTAEDLFLKQSIFMGQKISFNGERGWDTRYWNQDIYLERYWEQRVHRVMFSIFINFSSTCM